MDIDTWKMQEENILTTWQTPESIWALLGWLQVRFEAAGLLSLSLLLNVEKCLTKLQQFQFAHLGEFLWPGIV